jgi:hypothetical protein
MGQFPADHLVMGYGIFQQGRAPLRGRAQHLVLQEYKITQLAQSP